MKKIIVTFITVAIVVSVFSLIYSIQKKKNADKEGRVVKVGFIYEGDESTPYTNAFILAQHEAEKQFVGKIEVLSKYNVPNDGSEGSIEELANAGCDIIITNSYGFEFAAKEAAARYPKIQFCQATGDNSNTEPVLPNYHTFMGEIYQGRYIAGLAVGLKLKELISEGKLRQEDAKVGYVGAYPYAEVISGYTAFLLGIRSVVPTATMIVRYTNSWNSYSLEKAVAKKLIEEGCSVISQHSDTIGPATACEEAAATRTVLHAGYNQSMIDVAPTTSLISTRINWAPYITGAIGAVFEGEVIEKRVRGNIHGNDIGASFDRDWVQMLELNPVIAAAGTEEAVQKTIAAFKAGSLSVFKGNYTGTNPFDPSDTISLATEFKENLSASAPAFHYVLDGVIEVRE